MPNWCEGTLKIRGKSEDVKRFVYLGLEQVQDKNGLSLPVEHDDSYYIVYRMLYIKNTKRGFVYDTCISVKDDIDDKEVSTLAFDVRFAWDCKIEQILAICKEFDIDVRMHLFEQGGLFTREIEIIDKAVKKDITKEYKDYDEYKWECIMPNLGG